MHILFLRNGKAEYTISRVCGTNIELYFEKSPKYGDFTPIPDYPLFRLVKEAQIFFPKYVPNYSLNIFVCDALSFFLLLIADHPRLKIRLNFEGFRGLCETKKEPWDVKGHKPPACESETISSIFYDSSGKSYREISCR